MALSRLKVWIIGVLEDWTGGVVLTLLAGVSIVTLWNGMLQFLSDANRDPLLNWKAWIVSLIGGAVLVFVFRAVCRLIVLRHERANLAADLQDLMDRLAPLSEGELTLRSAFEGALEGETTPWYGMLLLPEDLENLSDFRKEWKRNPSRLELYRLMSLATSAIKSYDVLSHSFVIFRQYHPELTAGEERIIESHHRKFEELRDERLRVDRGVKRHLRVTDSDDRSKSA